MRLTCLAALTAVAAAGLSACAPSTGGDADTQTVASPRLCFDPDRITNFRTDRDSLYVRALGGSVYELSHVGACLDLDGANAIVLRPATGVASRLCVGDTAVAAAALRSAEPCRLRVTKGLTPEEVEALPPRARP